MTAGGSENCSPPARRPPTTTNFPAKPHSCPFSLLPNIDLSQPILILNAYKKCVGTWDCIQWHGRHGCITLLRYAYVHHTRYNFLKCRAPYFIEHSHGFLCGRRRRARCAENVVPSPPPRGKRDECSRALRPARAPTQPPAEVDLPLMPHPTPCQVYPSAPTRQLVASAPRLRAAPAPCSSATTKPREALRSARRRQCGGRGQTDRRLLPEVQRGTGQIPTDAEFTPMTWRSSRWR